MLSTDCQTRIALLLLPDTCVKPIGGTNTTSFHKGSAILLSKRAQSGSIKAGTYDLILFRIKAP
jgi:hypothetical protein